MKNGHPESNLNFTNAITNAVVSEFNKYYPKESTSLILEEYGKKETNQDTEVGKPNLEETFKTFGYVLKTNSAIVSPIIEMGTHNLSHNNDFEPKL